jgi:hypothetical protein
MCFSRIHGSYFDFIPFLVYFFFLACYFFIYSSPFYVFIIYFLFLLLSTTWILSNSQTFFEPMIKLTNNFSMNNFKPWDSTKMRIFLNYGDFADSRKQLLISWTFLGAVNLFFAQTNIFRINDFSFINTCIIYLNPWTLLRPLNLFTPTKLFS